MNKVAVVYWSSTGNTEEMAKAVVDGVNEAGANGEFFDASEFTADMVDTFDAIAFGCPAMGGEELEDGEFLPMFTACEPKLKDKKIALFGSYDWGDGQWMSDWEDTCVAAGAKLVTDSVTCNNEPDDEGIDNCKSLGKALAQA